MLVNSHFPREITISCIVHESIYVLSTERTQKKRPTMFRSFKSTLWLFNIAMENGSFIDGLPIKNGGSFHGYVK